MAILQRFVAVTLLCAPGAFAQRAPVDHLALQTRELHQNLLIVADPYVSADRYKGVFGKKSPYEAGIVAVDVYFRNDNDSPIRLNLETIRLAVSLPDEERQQLEPLSPQEVADRALLTANANPTVPRRPMSLPGMKSGKGKAWDEMVTSIGSVALASDVLPPHATTHGFLFFDLDHKFNAIRYSHVYIPDLSFMNDHSALLFFEIDLGTAPH